MADAHGFCHRLHSSPCKLLQGTIVTRQLASRKQVLQEIKDSSRKSWFLCDLVSSILFCPMDSSPEVQSTLQRRGTQPSKGSVSNTLWAS
jgi:hypothetical protein